MKKGDAPSTPNNFSTPKKASSDDSNVTPTKKPTHTRRQSTFNLNFKKIKGAGVSPFPVSARHYNFDDRSDSPTKQMIGCELFQNITSQIKHSGLELPQFCNDLSEFIGNILNKLNNPIITLGYPKNTLNKKDAEKKHQANLDTLQTYFDQIKKYYDSIDAFSKYIDNTLDQPGTKLDDITYDQLSNIQTTIAPIHNRLKQQFRQTNRSIIKYAIEKKQIKNQTTTPNENNLPQKDINTQEITKFSETIKEILKKTSYLLYDEQHDLQNLLQFIGTIWQYVEKPIITYCAKKHSEIDAPVIKTFEHKLSAKKQSGKLTIADPKNICTIAVNLFCETIGEHLADYATMIYEAVNDIQTKLQISFERLQLAKLDQPFRTDQDLFNVRYGFASQSQAHASDQIAELILTSFKRETTTTSKNNKEQIIDSALLRLVDTLFDLHALTHSNRKTFMRIFGEHLPGLKRFDSSNSLANMKTINNPTSAPNNTIIDQKNPESILTLLIPALNALLRPFEAINNFISFIQHLTIIYSLAEAITDEDKKNDSSEKQSIATFQKTQQECCNELKIADHSFYEEHITKDKLNEILILWEKFNDPKIKQACFQSIKFILNIIDLLKKSDKKTQNFVEEECFQNLSDWETQINRFINKNLSVSEKEALFTEKEAKTDNLASTQTIPEEDSDSSAFSEASGTSADEYSSSYYSDTDNETGSEDELETPPKIPRFSNPT